MRQRRHKRVRKAVRFYKVCFQFREPFKARALAARASRRAEPPAWPQILVDGNFLHACTLLKCASPHAHHARTPLTPAAAWATCARRWLSC